MKNRIQYLDYLRGLAAFGIMVYHFTTWSYGHHNADSFLGRIGIYAVSIFYILSGLTLFKVYYNDLDVKDFFVKRLFRIYPLLIVVTLVTVILRRDFDLTAILLNVTGLFGLFKWDQNIAVGAWSIGNELVFYLFFPLFVFFAKADKLMFCFLGLTLLSVYLYFAFYMIDPSLPLGEQGYIYMNPMNQIFLFLSGFAIGLLFDKVRIHPAMCITMLVASLIAFSIYPASGETSTLLYGIDRMIFTLLSIVICLSFFKLDKLPPTYLSMPLSKLGESTYSVYMLHPIVWTSVLLFSKYIFELSSIQKVIFAIPLTVIVSYLCYVVFEKYFIRLGNDMALKWKS